MIKHPEYADVLSKKLAEVRQDNSFFEDRKEYEKLIIAFEKVMDDCEVELNMHGNNSYYRDSFLLSIYNATTLDLFSFHRRSKLVALLTKCVYS